MALCCVNMKTLVASGSSGIAAAGDFLKQDQVVALPTETVYGLAGNAFSPQAVASIFEAKERPLSDPLIVHLLDVSWLDRVAVLSPELKKKVMALATAFWPGPLTLLLPKKETISDLVTAGLETVAVRIPSHPVMREILAATDLPLAAPSANRFGRISPTAASDVFAELSGCIPLILDGGPCSHGVESTIVWPHEDVLQILRPGPITEEELKPFGKVLSQSVHGKAPGSLKSHYAPRKPLAWYDPHHSPCEEIGLLTFSQPRKGYGALEVLSPSGDLREAAANLYGALRRLDESSVTSLVVEPVPEHGIGCAIMDRLRRAVTSKSVA